MATVYRAWDTRLQVHRAVKLLSPNLTHSGNIVERFLNEARAMARLHHPNIVAVHDVVSDGERSFIVLELVPGGSLRDWLDRHGAMPPRLAARTCVGILEALQAAHEAGVVHRDIKPQNILVSEKNQPMVTDFGIARFMGEDRSLTRTGSIMGTWGFMAPEQKTSAKSVDGRADLYAVGATLFTLLTNELPSDLFAADMDDELLGSLEPQLRDVVRHATRYRPEDRFPTAAEFAETLRLLIPRLPEDPPATPPLAKASTQLTTPPRPSKSALGNAGHTMEHMVSGGRENTIVPGGGESLRRLPGELAQDGTGLTSFEERAQPLAQRLFFGVSAFMFVVGLAAVVWALILRPAQQAQLPPVEVTQPAEAAPPVEAPPVEAPPVEAPPVEAPPVEPEAPPEEAPPPAPKDRSGGKSSGKSGGKSGGKATGSGATTPPERTITPASTAYGRVSVYENQANEVWLIAESNGQRFSVGEVPVGTYKVMATWGGDPTIAGKVKVEAGASANLRCVKNFERCVP